MAKKKKHQQQSTTSGRQIDKHFDALDDQFRHPANRTIQYCCIPIFSFAVLGLVWMIPFPEIGFLTRNGYDTFLNWGSFFIAGMIYYYLRLAPTLSYATLFSIAVFSFFIVQLEYLEQRGGPAVWMVCAGLLLVSLAALVAGSRLERKPVSAADCGKLLLLGPIWLWHFVFKKLNIPY